MKDKFIYKVHCSLFGDAYYTSYRKAIVFKDYLVKNYELEVLNTWKATGGTPFSADYCNGNFISISKIMLNIY